MRQFKTAINGITFCFEFWGIMNDDKIASIFFRIGPAVFPTQLTIQGLFIYDDFIFWSTDGASARPLWVYWPTRVELTGRVREGQRASSSLPSAVTHQKDADANTKSQKVILYYTVDSVIHVHIFEYVCMNYYLEYSWSHSDVGENGVNKKVDKTMLPSGEREFYSFKETLLGLLY